MILHRFRRRRLARLGTSLVAATALVAAVPAAASAQEEDGYVEFLFNDLTIGGPGAPGKYVQAGINLSDGIIDPVVTVDVSGTAGVVDVEFPEQCAVASGTVTCELDLLDSDPHGGFVMPIRLTAASGSSIGDSATISWTATAANADANPGSATITLGDGPDLVITTGGEDFGLVPPGRTVTVPIAGWNAGNQSVSGLRLRFGASGSEFGQYDNCVYVTSRDSGRAECDIDIELAPGDSFEVVDGFDVTPTETALRQEVHYTVNAAEESSLPSRATVTRGSGATLRAVATGSRTAGPSTADLNDADNSGEVLLDVDNQADFEVTGATASGAVGDEVEVTVGLTSLGPGTVFYHTGEPAANYAFHTPEGTEVTEVPPGCLTEDNAKDNPVDPVVVVPGADRYFCHSPFTAIRTGDGFEHTFTLRINEVIPDAEGLVQVTDYGGTPEPWYDRNLENSEALVLINPTGEHPGGGGGGGELPVTGARAGLVAAGGAALLIAGVVVFLIGRRKRVVLVTGDDETGSAT